MANPSDQPNPGQPRQLNLQQMADQFMVGVQRHFDMLAFNLASREGATEAAYDSHCREPRMMPASRAHQNFEHMQAYARDLLFCQVVNDSLNLAVSCLHNVQLFLAFLKAQKEHGAMSPESQRQAQEDHQDFLKAPLDGKFNRLEEGYGIMCELEDTITSLGFAMQALAQQGGIVKEPQLDEQNELRIELKSAASGTSPGDVWRQPENLEVLPRVFREGEKIVFSDPDLQHILLTIALFGHHLFSAVAKYARENPGS